MKRLGVSCLTVTQAGREEFLADAHKAFEDQTYPHELREHVIIRQPTIDPPTLGELRNQTLALAQGDFLCQWDDDDLYHHERIKVQHDAMVDENADICFIHQITLRCHCGYEILSHRREWENTMMVRAESLKGCQYRSLGKSEDYHFVEDLKKSRPKVALIRNRPDLYIYRIHRTNTWEPAHFDEIFRYVGDSHRPSKCLGANR